MGAAPLPSVVTTYASSMSSLWTPEGEHRVPRPAKLDPVREDPLAPEHRERPVRREAPEAREVREVGKSGKSGSARTPGGSQRKPAVAVRRGRTGHHERGRAGNRGGNARGRQAPCRRPGGGCGREPLLRALRACSPAPLPAAAQLDKARLSIDALVCWSTARRPSRPTCQGAHRRLVQLRLAFVRIASAASSSDGQADPERKPDYPPDRPTTRRSRPATFARGASTWSAHASTAADASATARAKPAPREAPRRCPSPRSRARDPHRAPARHRTPGLRPLAHSERPEAQVKTAIGPVGEIAAAPVTEPSPERQSSYQGRLATQERERQDAQGPYSCPRILLTHHGRHGEGTQDE